MTIGPGIPTLPGLEANAHALAWYAALCQAAGLVPIVEPEVLMDGDHTIERCFEVTETTRYTVFHERRHFEGGSVLRTSRANPTRSPDALPQVVETAPAARSRGC